MAKEPKRREPLEFFLKMKYGHNKPTHGTDVFMNATAKKESN